MLHHDCLSQSYVTISTSYLLVSMTVTLMILINVSSQRLRLIPNDTPIMLFGLKIKSNFVLYGALNCGPRNTNHIKNKCYPIIVFHSHQFSTTDIPINLKYIWLCFVLLWGGLNLFTIHATALRNNDKISRSFGMFTD